MSKMKKYQHALERATACLMTLSDVCASGEEIHESRLMLQETFAEVPDPYVRGEMLHEILSTFHRVDVAQIFDNLTNSDYDTIHLEPEE